MALAASTALADHHGPRIGSVGAGFLGAGLTIALALIMFGVLLFLGVLTVGLGSQKRRNAGLEVSNYFKLMEKFLTFDF